jgi:choice-of-anchor A domain-containing protein
MDMPNVSPPFLSANAPTNGTVNGDNYTYVLEGGKYMTSNLDAAGSSTTLMVQSDSILYVTGNVNLSKIVFAPGAKLDLYLGGAAINFTPTLVGATAPQFSIFGLPTCTSFDLSGGSVFKGLIYAPQCDLKAEGNSSIQGAIIAKSFTCSGTFDFHYDLAAGRSASALPFTILAWNELY